MLRKLTVYASLLALASLAGCPQPPTGNGGNDDISNINDNDNINSGDGVGDVKNDALNFKGALTGSAFSVSSTDAATGDSSKTATFQDNSAIRGWLEDLDGNRLVDASGNPYPVFSLTNSGFALSGLPVGVDIIVRIDLDNDGNPDLTTVVHIPVANADTQDGSLEGVKVDPLSTLAFAKIVAALGDGGIGAKDFGVSLYTLISRTREAFENLFSESGIDQQIDFESLRGRSLGELAGLFDQTIPSGAQVAVRIAQSTIAVRKATTADGMIQAIAPVLLQGGFMLADFPGGADLSFLNTTPNVVSFATYFGDFGNGPDNEQGPQNGRGFAEDPSNVPSGNYPAVTLYFSNAGEPNRNNPYDDFDSRLPDGPVFNDRIITRIAQSFLNGRTITMAQLHQLITDAQVGMGMRFVYRRYDAQIGHEVEVFTTADGNGVVKDFDAFRQSLQTAGLFDETTPFLTAEKIATVRTLLANFLANTAAPTFEQLFQGILVSPLPSAEAYGAFIRGQRAHLPYSLSGPSKLYVVANENPYEVQGAAAITVDATFNPNGGAPQIISYNSAGTGRFYLGFGPQSGQGQYVSLVDRTTGRFARLHNGRTIWVRLSDTSVFAPVNGTAFADEFGQTIMNLPYAPVLNVPNPNFDPSMSPDPSTNAPDFQVLVLMDGYDVDSEPVRVNYANNNAVYSPSGEFYLEPDFGQASPENPRATPLFLRRANGEFLETTPGNANTRVTVLVDNIENLQLVLEQHTVTFGVEVANPAFDPNGAPFFDDINNNGTQDSGEPVFTHRELLFNPADWRSTNIQSYYRRADNGQAPSINDVNFQSDTPKLNNGVELVPRNLRGRMNAWRYGKPNVSMSLLTNFSPANFFDGTQAFNAETELNILQSLAIMNLVFDQVKTVTVTVDWDGPGPLPAIQDTLQTDSFTAPIGDPLQLIMDGFETLASNG